MAALPALATLKETFVICYVILSGSLMRNITLRLNQSNIIHAALRNYKCRYEADELKA